MVLWVTKLYGFEGFMYGVIVSPRCMCGGGGRIASQAIYEKWSHFLHFSNWKNYGSGLSYSTQSSKHQCTFDILQLMRSSLLCSGFSKVFIDIMLELGHALIQNKGRALFKSFFLRFIYSNLFKCNPHWLCRKVVLGGPISTNFPSLYIF